MATKPSTSTGRGRSAASKAKAPAKAPALPPKDELLFYYKEMLLIRRFEEKAGQLYGMGLIGGFCHLYIGQEAVVVGMQACVGEGDSVITSYRDHGHMLACGMDPRGVMAELTGRSGGYSKGKGGSMHMFSKEANFYGGHGIVGAQIPLGTGIAFAQKYRGNDRLCLAYTGDGAVNQGQVYESFNMAALWKLPVIYIIENNKYAMGTSVQRASAQTDLHNRGKAYGIPGMLIDGMDVLKVKEAGEKAVAHVRAGKGPVILEMETYRYRGHSMSDPAKYRTKEEVDDHKKRDALSRLRKQLQDFDATKDAVAQIETEIEAEVREALRFAEESPDPTPDVLEPTTYVGEFAR